MRGQVALLAALALGGLGFVTWRAFGHVEIAPLSGFWLPSFLLWFAVGMTAALLLFVGIPLPGTGAWTGTLAASILDMKFKDVLIACMGGVLLAGIIMGLASMGVLGAASGLFAVG